MSTYGSDANLGAFENSFSEKSIRHAFMKKVYCIIMCQLAITTAFICLFLYEPRIKHYSMEHSEMFWIALAFTFILLIALACCEKVRRSFPANFICLFLFTFFESFLLGAAASRYDTEAVVMAAGICTVVCLGLTLFAFQTKIDFTVCSGFLMVCVLVLMVFGIIAIFIPGKIVQLIYGAAGAIIFSLCSVDLLISPLLELLYLNSVATEPGNQETFRLWKKSGNFFNIQENLLLLFRYLVFDTQLMIGGNHKYSLSPEEYIFAALNIYLDVINIFMSLLQIIGYARN